MTTEEWEAMKAKQEAEVKQEVEAREAQIKAEEEYQKMIAEEQAAYEAKRMGMGVAGSAPTLPPVCLITCHYTASMFHRCRRITCSEKELLLHHGS